MKLDVNDYTYNLPQERIALYPLPQRDQSKLLVYDRGNIHHKIFTDLVDFLPSGASLFFNETKVIPARLFFSEGNGSHRGNFFAAPDKTFNTSHRGDASHYDVHLEMHHRKSEAVEQ